MLASAKRDTLAKTLLWLAASVTSPLWNAASVRRMGNFSPSKQQVLRRLDSSLVFIPLLMRLLVFSTGCYSEARARRLVLSPLEVGHCRALNLEPLPARQLDR